MSEVYQEPLPGEKRKGNTGVWTFVTITGEGKVLATSEWGTNYEFNRKEWADLPKP